VKLQLLSDLHLESESFDPQPAPGAELLVLAGDVDSSWDGYQLFANWPVPVVAIAGNHEFDGRDFDAALLGLRERCSTLGITFLERQTHTVAAANGQRIRLVACTRWSDFDLFGAERRERAARAAEYFMRVMGTTRASRPFDAAAVRAEALSSRAWLETELSRSGRGEWDKTVAITHFAPSLRSADPRYGTQPGTASFCNADDDLIPRADLWLHGHLHCRQDYRVDRPGRAPTRVVCHPLGLAKKGEQIGHDPLFAVEV
jgi:predicted phosphodiesterase